MSDTGIFLIGMCVFAVAIGATLPLLIGKSVDEEMADTPEERAALQGKSSQSTVEA